MSDSNAKNTQESSRLGKWDKDRKPPENRSQEQNPGQASRMVPDPNAPESMTGNDSEINQQSTDMGRSGVKNSGAARSEDEDFENASDEDATRRADKPLRPTDQQPR